MPYTISEKCTACGACRESCPAEAILEGEPQFTIDADACIDCGQCVDTCPVSAIAEEA